MKAKRLLERCEKEIHKPWIKNKGKFLKRGIKGEFDEIRDIIKFKPPKWGDKEAFIKICDNRIDKLKTSSTEIVTILGAIMAVVAIFLIADIRNNFSTILSEFLLISLMVLILDFFYYRAQMYAWYAIKEGALLVKKEKK